MVEMAILDPSLVNVVIFMHLLSYYFLSIGSGIVLLYILILYKPEPMEKIKNNLIFVLIYAGILLIMFLIPEGVEYEILPDGSHDYPVWSLPLSLFLIMFFSTALIFGLIMSKNVIRKFSERKTILRMRILAFILVVYFYILIGLALVNLLDIVIVRQIFMASEGLAIVCVILFYLGFGRSLKE